MYVQYPAGVVIHETGAQDAHETGEYQQVGLPFIELCGNGPVEGLAISVMSVLNTGRWNAGIPRSHDPESIRFVGQHDRQLEVQAAMAHGVDKSLQVGARPRDQDRGFAASAHPT